MLPTPPIITTTSAFMVNSTPIGGIEGEEGAHQRAGDRHQRAAARKRDRRHGGSVDADEARARGLDRERTHRRAEARALEDEPDRDPEHAGDGEGQHPVGGEGEAEDAAPAC